MAGEMMADEGPQCETRIEMGGNHNPYSDYTNAALIDEVHKHFDMVTTALAYEIANRLRELNRLQNAKSWGVYDDGFLGHHASGCDAGVAEQCEDLTMSRGRTRSTEQDYIPSDSAWQPRAPLDGRVAKYEPSPETKPKWSAPWPRNGETNERWLVRVVQSMEDWVNR